MPTANSSQLPPPFDPAGEPRGAGDVSVWGRLRLIGRTKLDTQAKDMLRAMLGYADPATGERVLVSLGRLARDTSRTRRSAMRIVAELERVGAVQNRGRRTRDGLNVPSERAINFDRLSELVDRDARVPRDTSDPRDVDDPRDTGDATRDTGDATLGTPVSLKHPVQHPGNVQGSEAPAKADRKAKPKAPKTPALISWPLTLAERQDVHKLWSDWQDARFEAHREYSPAKSAQSQADRLAAFPIEAVTFRIRQALEGGWKGLQLDTLAADYAQHQARNPQGSTAAPAARDREALLRRVRALPEDVRRRAAEAVKATDARYSGWSVATFTASAPEPFVAELNGHLAAGVANG